jgi:rhodanese-related sulfurtransferase
MQQVLGLVLSGVQQGAATIGQAPIPQFRAPAPPPPSPPNDAGGLEPTLAALMRAVQDPLIQQLLGMVMGLVRQAAAMLGTPPVAGSGDQLGQSLSSLAGAAARDRGMNGHLDGPSPPASAQPPPGSAGGASGVASLAPLLGALMGALQNPAIQQILGLLLGVIRYAATAVGSMLSTNGMATGFSVPASMSGIYDATLGEPNQATAEVSTNELRRMLEQKSAAVFDGRTALEYAIGHIPGAVNVAPKPGVAMSLYVSDVAEIGRQVTSKDSPIVVYCNGPFCGKSRRLGEELAQAGFTNVKRYQLGTPVWRALVGMMAIDPAGVSYVMKSDRTAAIIDARSASEFALGSIPNARNVPAGQIIAAKDDGRLPMDDFNTRAVVFGRDGDQARTMAQALVEQGFTNVKFVDSTFSALVSTLS